MGGRASTGGLPASPRKLQETMFSASLPPCSRTRGPVGLRRGGRGEVGVARRLSWRTHPSSTGGENARSPSDGAGTSGSGCQSSQSASISWGAGSA